MEFNRAFSVVRSIPLLVVLSAVCSTQAAVEIDHDAIEKARSGKRIGVEAGVSVSGDAGESLSQVRTYFRADNDGRWHFVPMQASGAGYQGILPAPDIHTEFVRYQLLAITSGRNLVKSEIYNIEIVKDEEALARLNQQAPTDVKIDVSELQDAQDIYEKLQSSDRIESADRLNVAQNADEATPDSRVDIRSEYNPLSDAIPGFRDYINLSYVPGAESYGVTAGIVSAAAATAATAPEVASTTTAAAAGGGVSTTAWVVGGLAVAGGVAVASDSGGSSGSSRSSGTDTGTGTGTGGGSTPPPDPGTVTNFDGRFTSAGTCAATGNAAFRWVVDLNQTDDQVTGVIAFHKCPGEGRAEYSVTGTATTASSVQLNGTLTSSQGPMAATAPANQTFTVSVGQAPNPNFAAP